MAGSFAIRQSKTIRLTASEGDRMAAHRKSDRRRGGPRAGGLRKGASDVI